MCFYVVGVGGTGSLLARDLPQLLISYRGRHSMCLIDGDTVEEKNLIRQRFQEQDVGMNKAIALANKVNSIYPIDCEAMDMYVTDKELMEKIASSDRIPVILGCVDNDATRKILERTFEALDTVIYFDSANSAYSGNVFACAKCNGEEYGITRGKAMQLGDDDRNPADLSCVERSAAGELQYFITNLRMANCMLEHCYCLCASGEPLITGVTKIDRFTEIHY